MAPTFQVQWGTVLLVLGIMLVVMPDKVAAFGAGNIPSIAQVEGHNWRHGGLCPLPNNSIPSAFRDSWTAS